jgi:hypothetical protein
LVCAPANAHKTELDFFQITPFTFKVRPTLRTPLNIYVASICVSGVVTGLLAPLQIGFYVGPIHYLLPHRPFFYSCEVRRWLGVAFWAASTNAILCMLAIAVERFRILFHRASPRRSTFVVAMIAVVSILYDAGMFGPLEQTFIIVNVENPNKVCFRICI